MFSQLKNIDTAFKHIKTFSIVFLGLCMALSLFAIYKSYEMVSAAQERVYILANGKAIEAFSAERKDNIPVEARDHIRVFHHWFFSLHPDEKVIRSNLSRALYLADGSAKAQYDNLCESGYYAGLVSGNISQEITVDSIRLEMDQYPFYFTCHATQKLIRSSSVVSRSLLTQGYLRHVSRSDHNPHGFLIERWSTLENRDLSDKKK